MREIQDRYIQKPKINITDSDLAGLEILNFENMHLTDVSPFVGLTQLKALYLDSPILLPKAKFTGLKKLNLGGNQLTDVSPLIELKGLEILSLSGN